MTWRWFTRTETCYQLCTNDYLYVVFNSINYFIEKTILGMQTKRRRRCHSHVWNSGPLISLFVHKISAWKQEIKHERLNCEIQQHLWKYCIILMCNSSVELYVFKNKLCSAVIETYFNGTSMFPLQEIRECLPAVKARLLLMHHW